MNLVLNFYQDYLWVLGVDIGLSLATLWVYSQTGFTLGFESGLTLCGLFGYVLCVGFGCLLGLLVDLLTSINLYPFTIMNRLFDTLHFFTSLCMRLLFLDGLYYYGNVILVWYHVCWFRVVLDVYQILVLGRFSLYYQQLLFLSVLRMYLYVSSGHLLVAAVIMSSFTSSLVWSLFILLEVFICVRLIHYPLDCLRICLPAI